MYQLNIVECDNYDHAIALRTMLEGDGLPAVAATVVSGGDVLHIVLTVAPHRFATLLNPIAGLYARTAGGLDACRRASQERSKNSYEYSMPADIRDEARDVMLEAIHSKTERAPGLS
jgi:hypothetical protein